MSIDIGAAFKFALEDPQWMKKCLVAGLFFFVPVVGMIIVFGWMKRVFDQIRMGQPVPLPDIDFGGDLGRGLPLFLSMMNIAAVGILLGGCLGIVTVLASFIDSTLASIVNLLGALALTLVMMPLALLSPEFMRRALVHDEKLPLLHLGSILKTVVGDLGTYFVLMLGFVVAQWVGGLGSLICFVGVVFTLPWSYLVQAHLLAQYAACVEDGGR